MWSIREGELSEAVGGFNADDDCMGKLGLSGRYCSRIRLNLSRAESLVEGDAMSSIVEGGSERLSKRLSLAVAGCTGEETV